MQWNIFQLIISDRRVKLQRLRPHPKEPTKFPATFISVNGNCFITITVLSMSFGVNVHRELSTPVWIENALSAEWNPPFVYNMECERIPCSRRSDSRARSFFFFCLREFFSSALLSERLEQAKRLVNEYMCSMNYYDYYGLFYCCNYYN